MRYEYDDGLSIDYSGDIHITKGDTINLFIEEGYIPTNIKEALRDASERNSSSEMRNIATLLTDSVASRGCLADADSRKCANF